MFKRNFDELQDDLERMSSKRVCRSVTDFTLNQIFFYFNDFFNDKENPIDLTKEPRRIIAEEGSILERECIDHFNAELIYRYTRIPDWVHEEIEERFQDPPKYDELAQDLDREEDIWNDLFDFDN